MKPEVIRETTARWREEPGKAKSRPAVRARSDGSQAVMEAGSFTWRADLPAPVGGGNQAPSPTALLLGALAGCAVVFIRDTLAPQLGLRIDGVDATAECEADARGLLGMDGALPDLRDVQLAVRIDTPESEERLEALKEAWLARCPIYLALTKPLPVSVGFEVRRS